MLKRDSGHCPNMGGGYGPRDLVKHRIHLSSAEIRAVKERMKFQNI